MTSTAVAQLKASLSEHLARVKAGEEVIVTERGTPIAKIIPMASDKDWAALQLNELVRAGLLRRGEGKLPKGFWDMPRPVDSHSNGLNVLIQEREKGR